METLPEEVWIQIFSELNAEDLKRISLVCTEWREMALDWRLWARIVRTQWSNIRLELENNEDWRSVYNSLVQFSKLRNEKIVAARGVRASTTDHDQSIEWTLLGNYFWSSKPNPDPDSNEFLIYELTPPMARLEQVMIYPFENIYCYGPRQIRVSVGFSEDKYHYSTKDTFCENTSSVKIIQLPSNDKLPVGRFVRIDLIGRWQKHFAAGYQDRYYTCISSVILLGTRFEAIPGDPLKKGLLGCAAKASRK